MLQRIRDLDLWAPGARVGVAISGGVDSTVLLHLLHQLQRITGATLTAVHVDHRQHEGSGRVADQVQAFCSRLGVPLTRLVVDLAPQASEDACRVARFAAFDTLEVDVIALAHHRNDQAETVLLNLLRGTGPVGWGGMREARGRYVRPLLHVPRTEILAWATHHELVCFQDPANLDPRFLRSRIRHELVPLLEDLRPGSVQALARSASLAVGDHGLLEDLAAGLALETSVLRNAPAPLARRAIAKLIGTHSTGLVDAALHGVKVGRARVELPGGLCFLVDGEHVGVVASGTG